MRIRGTLRIFTYPKFDTSFDSKLVSKLNIKLNIKFNVTKLLILTLFSLISKTAYGNISLAPDYYIGLGAAAVIDSLGNSGVEEFESFRDDLSVKKVRESLRRIYQYPAFNYRFKNIKIGLIKGVSGQPNAYSVGPVIYVTNSLAHILTQEELTAVIAHEMGHSHKKHFAQKIPLPLYSVFYQLANLISLGSLDKKTATEFVEPVKQVLRDSNLALEMQADCIAYFQMEKLKQNGYRQSSQDLVSATNRLYGTDVTLLPAFKDPGIERAKYIKEKVYAKIGCNF